MRNHNFRGAGVLGHASAAMTLDVYAGLFGDDLDAVADRLDQAASAPVRTICGLRPRNPTFCRSTLETQVACDLRKHLVGRVGLEPTTQGL